MQRATDNLRADHRLVERAVQTLAAIADTVRDGGEFPAEDCAAVLRFLREWVLAVHMRKEDDMLAPAVAMRGDEQAAATVGELLRLREEIEELSHALVLFWEPAGDLTQTERCGFAVTADAMVQRLSRRQQLEEEILFPAYDRDVPADDQLGWLARFAQLETDRGSRADWAARIGELADRWR